MCLHVWLNGIGVLHNGSNLGDVAKAFTRNKLGCEEDTFIFWGLEKLMCVCVCVTNVVGILHVFAHLVGKLLVAQGCYQR
jgi:hypothetical protein